MFPITKVYILSFISFIFSTASTPKYGIKTQKAIGLAPLNTILGNAKAYTCKQEIQ